MNSSALRPSRVNCTWVCSRIIIILAAMGAVVSHAIAAEKPSLVIHSRKIATTGAAFLDNYGLTRDDLHWLRQLPGLTRVVAVREQLGDAWIADRVAEVRLIGTVAEYGKAHDLRVVSGRFLSSQDDADSRNVAVISDALAKELSPTRSPLGRHIRIAGNFFTVVGVVDSGSKEEKQAFIPLATMQATIGDVLIRIGGENSIRERFELSQIEFWLDDRRKTDRLQALMQRILTKTHAQQDFVISAQ